MRRRNHLCSLLLDFSYFAYALHYCINLTHPIKKKIRQIYFSNSLKSTHIIYNINEIHKLFNKFERKKKCFFFSCKEVCVSILSKPTQLQHEIVVLYSIILNVMVMFFCLISFYSIIFLISISFSGVFFPFTKKCRKWKIVLFKHYNLSIM